MHKAPTCVLALPSIRSLQRERKLKDRCPSPVFQLSERRFMNKVAPRQDPGKPRPGPEIPGPGPGF